MSEITVSARSVIASGGVGEPTVVVTGGGILEAGDVPAPFTVLTIYVTVSPPARVVSEYDESVGLSVTVSNSTQPPGTAPKLRHI